MPRGEDQPDTQMTSRQRVLAALAHKEPDRVPVDLGATPSSGISAIAYNRFIEHLGIPAGPPQVYDVIQQLAQPGDLLLERLGIDVIDIGRAFDVDDAAWYDVTLMDGSAGRYPRAFRPVPDGRGGWLARSTCGTEIAAMPAAGTFFDQTHFPYLDGYPQHFDDLDRAMSQVMWAAFPPPPWNHLHDGDFWQTLRSRARHLRATTDKAIMIGAGCNLFEWGTFLRRIDNFLMDLVSDEAAVERLLDALMERHLAFLAKVCDTVGDVVDLCRFGDDLGMDSGPFMSPEIYRRLFKPRHAELCRMVHRRSSMHTFLHSCGSIRQLLPDLIEAGFEVINPVQTSCRGMDPAELKREFGEVVTFWGGGCDTREVLNRASPDMVWRHVKERLEILAAGGGYVFNTVHNILPDVPPENVRAVFEALRDFARH